MNLFIYSTMKIEHVVSTLNLQQDLEKKIKQMLLFFNNLIRKIDLKIKIKNIFILLII
jgi:hypothetical protein